ncbi:MAG: SdpI family protein, partial [Chitinophagaceae bacterium]
YDGADMKPDKMGNKSELWLVTGIMTAVSLFVYFLLRNLHRIDPKRKDAPQSSGFHKLALGMVVFVSALSILIITSAKDGTVMKNLIFPLLGLMFAFIGNYMINIKPNYFAGFRLPWTLSSDENWRRTHQLGGKIWFAGGLLIAIVSLFLQGSQAVVFFISVMAGMVIIPLIYSYRFFKKHS